MAGTGNKIRRLRKSLHLTQAELGKRVGLSNTYISLIENNRVPIPKDLVEAFSKVLNVPIEEIVGTLEKNRIDEVKKMLAEVYDLVLRNKNDQANQLLHKINEEYTRDLENEEIYLEFLLVSLLIDTDSEKGKQLYEQISKLPIDQYPLLHFRFQRIKTTFFFDGWTYEKISKLTELLKSDISLMPDAKIDVAIIHRSLSYLYIDIEYYHWAYYHTEKCIDFFKENGYIKYLISVYTLRGISLWKQQLFDRAIDQYSNALDLLKNFPDELQRARILLNMGMLKYELGDIETAFSNFFESLRIAKKYGVSSYVFPLYNLSYAYYLCGDYENFFKIVEELMEIYKSGTFPLHEAKTYELLGDYYCNVKNDKRFIEEYLKSITLAKEQRNHIMAANVCYKIGKELNDFELLSEAADLFHTYFISTNI